MPVFVFFVLQSVDMVDGFFRADGWILHQLSYTTLQKPRGNCVSNFTPYTTLSLSIFGCNPSALSSSLSRYANFYVATKFAGNMCSRRLLLLCSYLSFASSACANLIPLLKKYTRDFLLPIRKIVCRWG